MKNVFLFRFRFLTFTLSLLLGCKLSSTNNQSKTKASDQTPDQCDAKSIADQLKELDASEADLVLGQHIKYSPESIGPCTMPKTDCQNRCASTFGGFMGIMFSSSHSQCIDQCQDDFESCMKKNADAIAKGETKVIDTAKIAAARTALLDRREQILRSLHLCSTNSDVTRSLSQELHFNLSKEDEWVLQRKIWKNLVAADYAVYATFRFSQGTAVDTPARRGYMTHADWLNLHEADSTISKYGLKTLEKGLDGLGVFIQGVDAVFTVGSGGTPEAPGDVSKYAIAPQHIVNIVTSCANVKDVCTAISCLGHRTQEVMTIRDNLNGLVTPEIAKDGRTFAVCRHYAPTFAEACNQWAKVHGLSDQMNCTPESKLSLMHAYPVINLTSSGKSYQYIYDLLNDPMTPDLVPTNAAANDSVRIPCDAVKMSSSKP